MPVLTKEEAASLLQTPACTIVGCDEVGMGSYAGPVITCACAVPTHWPGDPAVKDSKDMTDKQRRKVYDHYWNANFDWMVLSLGWATVEEIEERGLSSAHKLAHRRAIQGTYFRLSCAPIIIVDGIVDPELPNPDPAGPLYTTVYCLPKADALVPAVSLASVIAKVHRDNLMAELDHKYPGYDFASNAGYNSKAHVAGLEKLGPCPVHRKTFGPIRRLLEARSTEDSLFLDLLPQEGDDHA